MLKFRIQNSDFRSRIHIGQYPRRFFSWDSLAGTLFVFFVILLFPLLFSPRIFDPFKQTFSDFRITDIGMAKIRDAGLVNADTNIVLINTSELDITGFAALINKISPEKPKVIGIESILKADTNPAASIFFRQAVENAGNVVFANWLGVYNKRNDEFIKEINSDSVLTGRAQTGFANLLIDKDRMHSTVREFYPRLKYIGQEEMAFACKIVSLFNPDAASFFFNRDNRRENINYRANYRKFYFLDASDILESDSAFSFLHNKILLLGKLKPGNSSHTLKDMYFTPLNDIYVGKTFPDMYGIEIHANIISMILNRDFYNSMPGWLSVIIAFVLCYINFFVFSYISRKNKKWYEISSVILFLFQSVGLVYITIQFYYRFNYELKLTATIYSLALAILFFEAYNDSFKPLTLKVYYRIFKKAQS